MSQAIIFGGTGYIGRNLCRRLVESNRFSHIFLVDTKPPTQDLPANVSFIEHDIKEPILRSQFEKIENVEWIFHFAAVHREPGHAPNEYFEMNLPSTRVVAKFADLIQCNNILFTSSIAVYGPTETAIDEDSVQAPVTPYGISKLCCELALEAWLAASEKKRLIVVRPGVIYGPEDPGNIGRLIKAIQRRRFAFPGSKSIRKSYGYIEGLIDSFEFSMNRNERSLTYNYVEKETLSLGNLVAAIAKFTNSPVPTFSLPIGTLATAAQIVQFATGGRSPIHPARVRKAATQTWIVPKRLIDAGFQFKYGFEASLRDWKEKQPDDFSNS